jgi:hypothetical protein
MPQYFIRATTIGKGKMEAVFTEPCVHQLARKLNLMEHAFSEIHEVLILNEGQMSNVHLQKKGSRYDTQCEWHGYCLSFCPIGKKFYVNNTTGKVVV